MSEGAPFGTLGDLTNTVLHGPARKTAVTIQRGDSPMRYVLAEMRADEYCRTQALAVIPVGGGQSLFDVHRSKALRIIGSLADESAVPGVTLEEKMAFPIDGKPAIDFFAALPHDIFIQFDLAAAEVNLASDSAREMFEQQLSATELVLEVIAFCIDKQLCLSDLQLKQVFMSEIVANRDLIKRLRVAESARVEDLIRDAGKSTLGR